MLPMVMNGRRSAADRAGGSAGRLVLLAAAVPLAILFASGIARASDPLDVKLDRAKVMRIARPAATVILGNPAIADATIQDRMTLIITGRSYGTTNLIVLDQAGDPIADQLVTVSASDDDVVTVFAGDSRRSFSCSPECQPMLGLGDTQKAFDTVKSQMQGRSDVIQGATQQPAGAN
ncbi:hypothetical protein GGR25_003713 [Kaistia hirudinis]|uniref:Pilus formation protein N-terminal domain-containing protein n=2 Tax=Kaistia hirudinis TaxID=1293440 RepID=A0A840AW58_9HYPH|nr:hypothetical protein [Kaistia hirudinis]MBN9019238.1 pilus assembly protein N-terminal domain-containing protein [Hyphomicrobiales bacterium]